MPRRTATLVTSALLLIAMLSVAVLVRVDYAEMSPGPTFNTLGCGKGGREDLEAACEADDDPVLAIADAETYETSGHLNMTTVRVTGVGYRMNMLEAVRGWLSPDSAVVPHGTLYPDDRTAEEVDAENAEEFSRSQESAKVAALTELGYEIPTRTIVSSVIKDSPSEGVLHAGDVILAVDGTEVGEPAEVAELVTRHEAGEDVVFTVVRAEEAEEGEPAGEEPEVTEDVTVTTAAAPDDGRAIVGIQAGTGHVLPFDIEIELADIGGPSAGLMFALGLIDKLTPDDLTGGSFVAGTGTIDLEGNVGPIGGVSMKTLAARERGADFFLTPEENCAAAAADSPDGLTLVKVTTMDDALDALASIRDGDTGSVETCAAR
ncbi:PDZ domain-containing protein [Streptomyces sp. ACA25]|uniref:YlbL family protein n=1 Tax=Streptomyces sp. ACA25 TaxID=3022596 RepID=UPI0023071789|nr:PDZ domain-containing protein [Streptomyces sp. ACA25]MDB1086836.1 PDZ domain-containing protein [Streptomyces sp. ACA25]